MYLLVNPNGGKLWRFDYQFDGIRKTLAIGIYTDITLSEARTRLDASRKLLASGIDPMAERKALKVPNAADTDSFGVIAREWHTTFSPTWTAEDTERILSRLQRDIFPWIGARPIREVTMITPEFSHVWVYSGQAT